LLGAVQLWFIQRKKNSWVTVASAAPCHYVSVPDESPNDVVHIIVTDFDADADADADTGAARTDAGIASVSE
jgi:hypothetical protein